jgi:predicted 3-demethylubiquinone-9 3-methyltransferase (glyoxalase superfamily)
MQNIVTHLWFDHQAEEAATFYTSIFRNSRIVRESRYTEAAADMTGARAGSVMTVEFELNGQTFYALNGGPSFKFNEAISLFVHCEDQKEIDEYWNKLLAGGGKPAQCGWLKDRYGLSWQIVPKQLVEWMADEDIQKTERVMKAILTMVKMDAAALKRAYDGTV